MALTLNDLIDPEPAAPAGGLGLARYQAVMKPQASTAAASPIERYKQIQQEKPETPIERYRRMQPQTAAAVQAPERMPTDAAGVERAPGAVPSAQAERPSPREQFRAMQPKPREAVQTQPGGPSPADIIKAKYAGDLEAGWNVGVKSMQSLGAGAVGALGQAVGSDSMREWGVGHMQRLEREMQPWMAGRPTKLEDIKGVGDAADWAQFTAAQVAPSILESVGAAIVGGALGSAAAPGAGTAVGALGGAAAKGAVKGALSKYLAKATSEAMLRGATREAAEQAAKRTVGAQAGAAIGMFGSSYLQGVGDVYGETLDENGRGDLLSSFALAVPYAALDSVVEMGVLGKIAKGSPGEEALKRYTRAILGTAVKEGSTEAAQEALVLLAGVKNDQEYSSEEVLSRLGNGFAAGFLAGGVMGAPAGRAQREQTGFGELVVDVLPGGEDPVNGMARPELRTALTDPSMPDPVRARAFAAVTAALEGLDPVMGAAFKDVAAEALARRTTAVPTDAFMTAMTGGRRAGKVEPDAAGADTGAAAMGQGEEPGPGGVTDPGPGALAEQTRAAREAQWAQEDAARAAGQVPGQTEEVEADRRETAARLAAAIKPSDIAWVAEPLDSQMVEGRGGLWTREVQRSADGAWVLERAITPDGELARERVQTFEGWAQNKRAGIDAAEEDARAQVRRWRVENPNTPEPKAMADALSELRAQRRWLDGVERAGKATPVGEEATEIQGRQVELYRKALVGERVSKAVAEAPETAWLRERFAGTEEAPTVEEIGAALREYQPDGGQADEFASGGSDREVVGTGMAGSGEPDAAELDGMGAGADRGGALSGKEAEALAPGAQGLPREQVEGQGAAESAGLLTPERPTFVPTHVLSDGTPVAAVEGESNVYLDETGIEIEDDYAELVQQPWGAAEPAGAGARESGALAEAAAAEPGAGSGAAEPAGAGGRAVGAGEPVSGVDDAPALTPEAAEVLKAVDEGGLPFAKTRNPERIAAENGVEVSPETTPEQIVAGLRARAGEPLRNPEEFAGAGTAATWQTNEGNGPPAELPSPRDATPTDLGQVVLDPYDLARLPGASGEERLFEGSPTGRLSETEWSELVNDIRNNGVKQPPLIVKGADGRLVVQEGNHRIRAAIEAGVKKIPVDIRYMARSNLQGRVPFGPQADAGTTTEPTAAADPASAWEATGARNTESVKQRIQWLRQAGLRGAGLADKAWGDMTPEQQGALAGAMKPAEQPSGALAQDGSAEASKRFGERIARALSEDRLIAEAIRSPANDMTLLRDTVIPGRMREIAAELIEQDGYSDASVALAKLYTDRENPEFEERLNGLIESVRLGFPEASDARQAQTQPTETRAPAVGEGATLPDQKGRFKYRVASVQPEQQGGYVRIERARKSGDAWTEVQGEDGSNQLSREYVLSKFGVRAVHRDDDLRGTGIGDEIRQQRENDALATRQQQARAKATADNLSDRAQMALRDLMIGRPETVRKDVARGNLTAEEAIALVDRLEADNAFAGGKSAAEKARQEIEFGRADAATDATAAEPSAWTPENQIKIAADSVERLRQSDVERVLTDGIETAEQQQAVADFIKGARPELAAEVDALLADEEVRVVGSPAAPDQPTVNDATPSAETGKAPDAGPEGASNQATAGGPYKIGDKVLYESVITGEKSPAVVIRVRRDGDGKEFIELDTGERGIPASSPQLSRAEPTPKQSSAVAPEPKEPSHSETSRAIAAAQKSVFDAVIGTDSVRNAARNTPDTLQVQIERSIYEAVHTLIGETIEAGGPTMRAEVEALNALLVKNSKKVNPEVFTPEVLQAWGDAALRQARKAAREEQKQAHEQAIVAALADAYGVYRKAHEGAPSARYESEFARGFQHALDGETRSNLAPPHIDILRAGVDRKVADAGYDAGATWLQSEDGKAFAAGRKPRKMEGAGQQLRRRQDAVKGVRDIDIAKDEDADAFVDQILVRTERGMVFQPQALALKTDATPGLVRYLTDLRNQIIPFKEWIGSHGYGNARRKYYASPVDVLRKEAAKDADERAKIQEYATYYVDQVAALADVFENARTVADAIKALEAWTFESGKELTEAAKAFFYGTVQWKADPSGSRSSSGKQLRALSRSRLDQKFSGNPAAYLYGRDEKTPSDTTRNKQLVRPRFDRVERDGKDHRAGRNVSAEELASAFNLRGVTYGESVTAQQRQDHTNYAFDAFMDLAEVLGIQPKDIGLGGRLAFAFGALGRGRASAHYTPDNNGQGQAINLTNTRGDGAVAHEWFHALDWNLRDVPGAGGVDGQQGVVKDMVALLRYDIPNEDAIVNGVRRFLSGGSKWTNMGRDTTPQDHARLYLKRTIADLSNVVERGRSGDKWAGATSTHYHRDALALGKDYWGNPAEEFARAAEAFVFDALEGRNNYLVSDWVESGKTTAPKYRGTPYPMGEERPFFNDAFRRMFEALEFTEQGPRVKGGGASWEASPLRQKALDAMETAKRLMADLDGLLAQEQEKKAAKERAAQAQKEQAQQEREAAEAKAREEQAAKLKAEWDALQAQNTPKEPAGFGDLENLSDADLEALFDAAAAQQEEAAQEPERGSPEAEPTKGAETSSDFVDDPTAPIVSLARTLAKRDWTGPLSWQELFKAADQAFGGTRAQGTYSTKDAYDALEMALNLRILGRTDAGSQAVFRVINEGVPAAQEALKEVEAFDNAIPTQTNRTAEQDEFQQFSTPHTHSALMARVANITDYDVVLEPSGGSGNLAVTAAIAPPFGGIASATGEVVMNELAPRRAAILKALGAGPVYTENAEHLNAILGPRGLKPTVVMMNPPFSASAGRVQGKRDNRIGAQHVAAALKLLAPGGRLVALMGDGYTRGNARVADHWKWVLQNFNVRANLGLDGAAYRKFGTTFDNRLVVIDNTGPTTDPDAILGGHGLTVAQALEMLEGIRNDRVHVGERFGTEPGGGRVAEAGGLPQPAGGAGAAAAGPLGAGESGPDGAVGEGARDDGGTAGAAGAAGSKRPGGRGPRTGGRGGRKPGAATGRPGTHEGRRGDGAPGEPVRDDRGAADPERTKGLAEIAAEAAKHGVTGIGESLAGMFELFGGNRIKSFPAGFDAETYAKAKPHFQKAAQEFVAAGRSIQEFFAFLIQNFGAGIKPYAMQFMRDLREQPSSAPRTDPVDRDDSPANEPIEPPAVTDEKPQALTDAIYDGYRADAHWAKQGAQPHPGALVESAAMAAVKAPALTARPNLPKEVITEGRLSDAQLDVVAYAQQAHEQMLPDEKTRMGFFIGDGTGLGKGREISGIIFNNWRQGRTKAVWISVTPKLAKDSREYLTAVAGSELGLFELSGVDANSAIDSKEGVLFATYGTLISKGQGVKDETGKTISEGQQRIDQLVKWLGEDFDGVIAFDEAHTMGNAIETKGTRGGKKPSKTALTGVDLQTRLPKARIVYASATGATEVSNLAYAERLGLWGEGTPFADKKSFIGGVAGGGVAAMEVVAKDLKALGVYQARSLSYDGVSYAQLEHTLTEDQRTMYDVIAGAWQKVLTNMNAALEDTESGKDGMAKGAALSAFWGAQQRFFNQMLTALQMPSVVASVQSDLDAGRSVVLQIVNTNEAATERAAAQVAAQGRDLEDLDITPRQTLMQYLTNAFPVNQFETYTDDDGNERVRPVTDSAGNPIQNPEAVAARDRLLDEVATIRFPDGPMEILLNHFGADQVAEITGRKRRFVRSKDENGIERMEEQKRSEVILAKEAADFQAGKRRILIFSDAGGTGLSYHADKAKRNQQKRVHYLLQPGWRADKAIQGLGRSHRTNQAQPPHVVLVTTDLRGHRRFVASIARRMDQLGALTKGQRQTGGQGIFTPEMNLESDWSARAIETLIADVTSGRVKDVTADIFADKMGLDLRTKEGNRRTSSSPSVQQFLNRILVLDVELQARVFDAFFERLQQQIEAARAAGVLDVGMETINALRIRKTADDVVYTHEATGAQTRLVDLELTYPVERWSFDRLMALANTSSEKVLFFKRNRKSGKVYAFARSTTLTRADGRVVERYRRLGVRGRLGHDEAQVIGYPEGSTAANAAYWNTEADKKWETLGVADAATAWGSEYDATPTEDTETIHMLTGVLLPIWDRLGDFPVAVKRALTQDGELVLGREVPDKFLDQIQTNLTGSSRAAKLTPAELMKLVMGKGATVRLANNWRLERRKVGNEWRMELAGRFEYREGQLLQEQGVIFERIGWESRYFVPTGPAGVDVLARVMKNRPAAEIIGGRGDSDGDVRMSRADGKPAAGGTPGKALSPRLQRTLRRMLARGERGAAGGLAVLSGSAAERAAAFAKATGRPPDAAAALALAERRAQGAFDPKSGLLFVAGDLDADTAVAVLLHEATHGQRRPALDARVQALLAGEVRVPAETRAFLDRVQARMARVGESGAQGEALAYVVEAAALEGRQAGFSAIDGAFLSWVDRTLGQPIGELLRRLVAQVRAWALQLGLPMNPAVDDLLALARGDLSRAARGDVVTEVDGVRVLRGAEGRRSAADAILRAMPQRAARTLEQARRAIGAWIGRPLRNTETGLDATVSRGTLGKMTSDKAVGKSTSPEDHALAVANLDQLFRNAKLERSHPDASGEPTIAAIHRYVAPMITPNGSVVAVKMTVKETTGPNEPNPLYTIETLDVEKPTRMAPSAEGIERGIGVEDVATTPTGGLTVNVVAAIQEVKDALVAREQGSRESVIRYSLADPTDRGGSPLGGGKALQDAIKTFTTEPGAWSRDKWLKALPTVLGAVTLRQLADLGEGRLQGLKAYNAVRSRMETRRNAMVEESGQFAEEVWQRWAGKRENTAEAAELNDFIHRTTLDQVDPDRYETLKITVQLGPGALFKRVREATQANVDELNTRARQLVRSKKLEDKGLAPYYQAAAKQLALAVRAEKRRLAKLPELAKRWAALSDGQVFRKEDGAAYSSEADAQRAIDTRKDLQGRVLYAEQVDDGWVIQEAGAKQIYRRARDLYKQRGDEMMEALIARVSESRGLDEVSKRALAAKIRAEFEQTMDEKGNPRIGPYFPLQRFGRFYTSARRFPTGAARTFRKMDGGAFASESAARSAIGRRADLREVDVKPVELKDGSGWVLEELGEPGFWMYEDTTEQRRDAMRLQAEGWTSLKQGLTQEAGKQGAEAVSEGFMAQAVKQLQDRGATDEADMLYQMYLQTLNQMSIRKHFIHRKGTAGYSNNALRSFGWNMTRLAHQVSKLEYVPQLERMVTDIEEGKKERRNATPDADIRVEDAFFQELQKRHTWVVSPDNASWTNFTSALGFFWYLGVTPAAALVNLSQTPIVALPTLAARFRWGPSARALGQAAVDVMRGFNPTVVKGFMVGTPRPSQAANLSADEQAAFDAWSVSGVRDRTRAHNLAGIGDTDAFWNGPTFNKGMAIVSSLFHAGEVVNRDVTLLAGYRLARKAGQSHAAAVRAAEEMTWESHFDYSNANRARAMQGNLAKVFLMFRSYSQHVTYFMWRNLYQWTKGESKAVRAEARTKFLGLMGMTGLFAGSAGLPMMGVGFAMANVMAALFGDDDEPWDAETEWRRWLAQAFPSTVGDILDRGVANTATGMDWSTRVSLRELWFRDPNRDLDGAGMYQHIVEQVLGPIGGIVGSPFTAADMIADGHWDRAAEAMTPKFLRDALKAGRYAEEGVQTLRGDPVLESLSPYEILWTAMGMQLDALRVQWDRNNAVKRYEGEILDRRSRLMTAAALALIHGDREGLANVTPKIERFNAAQPTIPITMRSLRTSVRNRIRYSEEAEGGIAVNRGLGHLREVAAG